MSSESMSTSERIGTIRETMVDLKAVDPVEIDLEGRTILADVMIVCTATSDTHARAIVDAVFLKLKGLAVRPLHIERDDGNTWIVMDYGDVVVHIFQEQERCYYDLEELWGATTGSRRLQKPEFLRSAMKRPERAPGRAFKAFPSRFFRS